MKHVFLVTNDKNDLGNCEALCHHQNYHFAVGTFEEVDWQALGVRNCALVIDLREQPLEIVKTRMLELERAWQRPIIVVGEYPKRHLRYDQHVEIIADLHTDAELLFAINVIMRLIEKMNEDNKIITHPDLRLNLHAYEVHFGQQVVALTYKEFQILTLLATSPEQVYSRAEMLNSLGIVPLEKEERSIDHIIKRMRKKIGKHLQWEIRTIYGRGYMFHLKKG